jgi:hypothetical protein
MSRLCNGSLKEAVHTRYKHDKKAGDY